MLPQADDPEDEHAPTIVSDVMFTSTNALFQRLHAVPGDSDIDSLVVGQVSVDTFRVLKAERDRRGHHYRFFFLPDLACLIVTIPTSQHERAHLEIYTCVHYALMDMGVRRDQWTQTGTADFDAQGGASGSGQGDSSGGPSSRRDQPGNEFWPTLVIEAGASQTLLSLRIKARWWFAASNFHMKVVVLVKLIVATSIIKIEQWVTEVSGPQHHGATTTRSRATRQPVLKQQVSIEWVGPSPLLQTPLNRRALSDFRVTGAPLLLRFEDLMERPPVPAAGEHDIVISEADLQSVAKSVW